MRHALTILAVQNLDRAVRFYTGAFAWPKTIHVDVYAEFSLPRGMRLGLYDRQGFARNTGRTPTPASSETTTATELYFYTDDLDAASDALRAAGAELLSPRSQRPWGDEAAYFRDLDGNVIVAARPSQEGGSDPEVVARQWMRTWESGDTSFLDATHDEQFIDRAAAGRDCASAGFAAGVRSLYAAFPDFHARVEDLLVHCDEQRVTVRWSARGTHRGVFLGLPATNRVISFGGIEIITVQRGRITERWGEWDGLSLLEQLGATLST